MARQTAQAYGVHLQLSHGCCCPRSSCSERRVSAGALADLSANGVPGTLWQPASQKSATTSLARALGSASATSTGRALRAEQLDSQVQQQQSHYTTQLQPWLSCRYKPKAIELFAGPFVTAAASEMNTASWWEMCGGSAPILQRIADEQ